MLNMLSGDLQQIGSVPHQISAILQNAETATIGIHANATVVTPQLTSHRAISSRSAVKVGKTFTGFSFRSEGTAAKISRAPMSIPAAISSKRGRSSGHPASSPSFAAGGDDEKFPRMAQKRGPRHALKGTML